MKLRPVHLYFRTTFSCFTLSYVHFDTFHIKFYIFDLNKSFQYFPRNYSCHVITSILASFIFTSLINVTFYQCFFHKFYISLRYLFSLMCCEAYMLSSSDSRRMLGKQSVISTFTKKIKGFFYCKKCLFTNSVSTVSYRFLYL